MNFGRLFVQASRTSFNTVYGLSATRIEFSRIFTRSEDHFWQNTAPNWTTTLRKQHFVSMITFWNYRKSQTSWKSEFKFIVNFRQARISNWHPFVALIYLLLKNGSDVVHSIWIPTWQEWMTYVSHREVKCLERCFILLEKSLFKAVSGAKFHLHLKNTNFAFKVQRVYKSTNISPFMTRILLCSLL